MLSLLTFIAGNVIHSYVCISATNLTILPSEIGLFSFIFHVFCNNSEKLYDVTSQFIFQAFSFSLLELYKMLTSLFFIDLKTENEISQYNILHLEF